MYSHASLAKAMCSALAPHLAVAFNFELPIDGTVPDWVELIPAGDRVEGRDGRAWLNPNPDEVIAASRVGRDIPLDWEHATELKAPNGEEAPAAGWFPELQNRGGAIWARVEWTPRGRASVANREYRYLSPVFIYEKTTGRIIRITSAGLTNQPNLHLRALNRQQQQEKPMALAAAIAAALGLSVEAADAEAVTAINRIKEERTVALNTAQNPSLEKFVPRADYDTVLARATNAEKKLSDQQAAQRETEIGQVIDQALKAGKITPATVEYHKAACRQDGGLDAFKKYVETAPVVADPSGLDNKKPGDTSTALNAEQQKVADAFGNSAEDIAKYGK